MYFVQTNTCKGLQAGCMCVHMRTHVNTCMHTYIHAYAQISPFHARRQCFKLRLSKREKLQISTRFCTSLSNSESVVVVYGCVSQCVHACMCVCSRVCVKSYVHVHVGSSNSVPGRPSELGLGAFHRHLPFRPGSMHR